MPLLVRQDERDGDCFVYRAIRPIPEAESLELLEKYVGILGIVEDVYPDSDSSQDRTRIIINKRYIREKASQKAPIIPL